MALIDRQDVERLFRGLVQVLAERDAPWQLVRLQVNAEFSVWARDPGFELGRALRLRLLARGDQVVAIDSVAGGIPAGAEVVAGDLGDPAVRAAALAGGLDALIHLATVPGGAAEADPRVTFQSGQR